MANLYEISFLCISKKECDGELKAYYKKILEDIFQNERLRYGFEKKTFIIKDPQFNNTKSSIQLFRKLSDSEFNKKNEDNKNKDKDNKDKDNKDKIEYNKKVSFCAINKEKLYSNITFYDSIGKFLEKTLYFVKYISPKKVELEQSKLGETKIIEIARCGYNMENILKDLGYKESKVNCEVGFFYQYKYYPIICIYQIITGYSNIFLQIRGYYIDNTKDEIIGILNEIIKQLSEYFIIK
jgi:hypothetical protein